MLVLRHSRTIKPVTQAEIRRLFARGASRSGLRRLFGYLHATVDVYKCVIAYTFIEIARMRTNIEIDDELLASAMKASGLATKRATVEEGLRLLVRLRSRAEAFEELRGMGWEGNLDEMREGRFFDDHDPRG